MSDASASTSSTAAATADLLDFYPPGPAQVPDDLARPSSAYRRHAWLAMLGLVSFALLYCFLIGWFGWTGYRVIAKLLAGAKGSLSDFVALFATGFLAVFMLKALFFKKHGGDVQDLEVSEDSEPQLVAFLHRIADEAGAPRPHRIFLSHRVNAAVFYDLSVLNLLFPSKKNLEIGLGLVNVLTLSELKAVLAHEFGHFAQRTMAVGRWVYIAQQIVAQVVAERGMLDRFLQGLSRTDIRIAWVGWILRLVIWSIRSLLETVFTWVLLAQRALSREMEFQADLVSVSLSGSDALVHALHRLQAADGALDTALEVAGGELAQGRAVPDLFALQTRVIERTRVVLDDETYGDPPDLPEADRETHRVFESEMAQPPRMWATHPPNRDREDNAKRCYLEAPLVEDSAWQLFRDPTALRARATRHLLESAGKQDKLEPADPVDALEKVEARFARASFDPRYRGAYLGRSITRSVAAASELYHELDDAEPELYPDWLRDQLEQLRGLSSEIGMLEALRAGKLSATDGVIRHRGRELQKSELSGAIELVRKEQEQADDKLAAHDRNCRSYHLRLARSLSVGAESRLIGLGQLLHYAEHTLANVRDVNGFLANVFAIVTADRNVSSRELDRLIGAASELYWVLHATYRHAPAVALDDRVAEQLEVASWSEAIGELELPPPDRENLSQWLGVIDSWVGGLVAALDGLAEGALDVLLEVEAEVSRCTRDGSTPTEVEQLGAVPESYPVLLMGKERALQTKLGWWDRFQTADGWFAGALRLIVALAIAGSALSVGWFL